ncbi:MAG: hydroxyacylglutathione hydrolase [Gammaproteobacteria bacterium]|nr:hydroxyacylglutathione hydrolase [Gammaproteobacteria bacterium]
MMKVHKIPAFDDNYIWLIGCEGRSGVAIVDPGDAEPVIDYLQREGLQAEAILITHHHGDHTGGVAELVARYPVPVYGPATERIPALTHPLREGDRVKLATCGLTLKVIDTPGHTRGHICYYGHGALFSGDTLFTAGCGRLFEGSAEQMHHSLEKLRALPDETLLYCAHEYTQANLGFAAVAEPDNPDIASRKVSVERLRREGKATVPAPLSLERATNPFLRSHLPVLIAAAERFSGRTLTTPAEVFAVVRQWKDSLD